MFTVTRNHWEMFPHDREVPEKLLNELIGIMVHTKFGELQLSPNDPQLRLTGHSDDMTSYESTSFYSGGELQEFISCANQIKSIGRVDGYSACMVG